MKKKQAFEQRQFKQFEQEEPTPQMQTQSSNQSSKKEKYRTEWANNKLD